MNATHVEPATALAELKETKPDKVTLVVLSGDMDRVMAALIIATGAAAMGMKVTMFFTPASVHSSLNALSCCSKHLRKII